MNLPLENECNCRIFLKIKTVFTIKPKNYKFVEKYCTNITEKIPNYYDFDIKDKYIYTFHSKLTPILYFLNNIRSIFDDIRYRN